MSTRCSPTTLFLRAWWRSPTPPVASISSPLRATTGSSRVMRRSSLDRKDCHERHGLHRWNARRAPAPQSRRRHDQAVVRGSAQGDGDPRHPHRRGDAVVSRSDPAHARPAGLAAGALHLPGHAPVGLRLGGLRMTAESRKRCLAKIAKRKAKKEQKKAKKSTTSSSKPSPVVDPALGPNAI